MKLKKTGSVLAEWGSRPPDELNPEDLGHWWFDTCAFSIWSIGYPTIGFDLEMNAWKAGAGINILFVRIWIGWRRDWSMEGAP